MVLNIFKKNGEQDVELSAEETEETPPITAPPPPLEFSDLPNLKPVEDETIPSTLITPPKLVPVEEAPVKAGKPKKDEPRLSPPLKQEAPSPPEFPPQAPAVPPEKKILKDRPLPAAAKPLFVKVSDYKAILDCTNIIKGSIKEAENIILRLNELKNEEDKAFEIWRNQLEDIQRKLSYIDKSVFEAG